MTHDIMLNIIDDLDDASIYSEFAVLEAVTNYADKLVIYQEAKAKDNDKEDKSPKTISDHMKDMSKNDKHKIITAIFAIPRFIIALAKVIVSKLSNTGLNEAIKAINEKGNKDTPRDVLMEARVSELNKKFAGKFEFYYDEKKDKIRIKKDWGRTLANLTVTVSLVFTSYELFKRAKQILDNENPTGIKKLINDFRTFNDKNGRNAPDESGNTPVTKEHLIGDTIDAFEGGIGDVLAVAGEITLLGEAIKRILESKIAKNSAKKNPNEAYIENLEDLNELSNTVMKTCGIVTAAVASIAVFRKIGSMIKGVADTTRQNNYMKNIVDHKLNSLGFSANEINALIMHGWIPNPTDEQKIHYLSLTTKPGGIHMSKFYTTEFKQCIEDEKTAIENIMRNRGVDRKYVSVGEVDDEVSRMYEEEKNRIDSIIKGPWREYIKSKINHN